MVHGLETLERLNGKAVPINHGSRLPEVEMRLRPVNAVSPQHTKKVVVANDQGSLGEDSQAMYVDGKLVFSNTTIYACQLESFVGGSHVPFTLSQEDFESTPDPWPETIEELRAYVPE